MRPVLALLVGLGCAAPLTAQKPQHGLRVPEGFSVTEFADSSLANDIYCLTIDARGRVLVSGRGYLRVLQDSDGDGKADKAHDFASEPADGAMGLLWEDDVLYFVGDGGLRRVKEVNGKADGKSELIRKVTTGGEHAAHALRRGPDGWLYLLCGNNSGVDKSFATWERSPIRVPTAGTVLRFSPDFKNSEIVADGFRNPYGMDFNGHGELFTYDSDNERCVALPWYEPTRFYHVVPGGHYGWRGPQRGDWWRLPPYLIDVVPPLVTLERGSPTGVVCYRHTQFPKRYRDGFFALDWTFGRIWFVSLDQVEGDVSYTAERELFAQAVGDNGFAPTAAAVDPKTGDLYVSIGGRGTRGAVYRIRYDEGVKGAKPLDPPWERDLDPRVSDSVRTSTPFDRYVRQRDLFTSARRERIILRYWNRSDRLLQQGAASLVATLDPLNRAALRGQAKTIEALTVLALGCVDVDPDLARDLALELLGEKTAVPTVQLGIIRVVQLALGDIGDRASKGTIWEGYTPARAIDAKTRKAFLDKLHDWPTATPRVEAEALRTLAMLEDDNEDTLKATADLLTADSSPLEDIHNLIVISRLKAARDEKTTTKIAAALLGLDRKQAKVHRDRHWPMRLSELHTALVRKDDRLNSTLLDHADFGRPEHALWTKVEGFPRAKAAEDRFKLTQKGTDYPWSADLVDLLSTLPAAKSRPVLRKLWGEVGLDELILTELARQPEERDRPMFVRGLASPQMATLRTSLAALQRLPEDRSAATLLALVQAMRRLDDSKEEKPLREQIGGYLAKLTGEKALDRDAWVLWFKKQHPAEGKALDQADGVDREAWTKRLAGLDWERGDAERGRQVYTKASCAACHSGSLALGPDLAGVTGRFSRDDLFTAILQPSKEVPARYRTTLLVTRDDKVYQGLIVYEATDSIIVQTGATATMRLDNGQVRDKRPSLVSLMPTGLLDRLSDQDITDLYAFLKSLTPRQKRRRRVR